MNNLVDAGNLLYPTKEAIEKLGWKLKEEVRVHFGEERLHCEATNGDLTLFSSSPLKILGLIQLVEIFGPRPWERKKT